MAEVNDILKNIWDLTNTEQSRYGLSQLTFDWKLAWAAMKHSTSMDNNDFFAFN